MGGIFSTLADEQVGISWPGGLVLLNGQLGPTEMLPVTELSFIGKQLK